MACHHVSSLRTSLTNLTHLSLSAKSAGQIKKDLANVETQIATLKTAAGGKFSGPANQIGAALDQVKKAARGIASPPTAAQVQLVVASLKNLKAASASAIATMNAACLP
jgi:hypothetical protein